MLVPVPVWECGPFPSSEAEGSQFGAPSWALGKVCGAGLGIWLLPVYPSGQRDGQQTPPGLPGCLESRLSRLPSAPSCLCLPSPAVCSFPSSSGVCAVPGAALCPSVPWRDLRRVIFPVLPGEIGLETSISATLALGGALPQAGNNPPRGTRSHCPTGMCHRLCHTQRAGGQVCREERGRGEDKRSCKISPWSLQTSSRLPTQGASRKETGVFREKMRFRSRQ